MPRGGADNPNDTPDVESTADLDESTAAVVDASERIEPAEDSVEATEDVTEDAADEDPTPEKPKRQINWTRVFAYGVLPGIALVLAMTAGYLKWQDNSVRDSDKASAEAMQMAKDSTVKMLSYKPESVDKDLNSARDLLTGEFRDQYTSLINDVVIPGAQQKKISAVATVPAAATVSADPNKAVMLLFVNQTVVVGQDAPTDTASSVRVTLEKSGDHWLISHFDPV
jgi:Mce-associated membrane protein